MPAVVLNRDTAAWRHQKPVRLTARLTVDYDLIKQVVEGKRIADLPSLWPYNHFRQKCIDGAKAWLGYMKQQDSHYELIGNETDIKVWAPAIAIDDFDVVVGRSSNEFPFPRGKADILFEAYFKAKYARDVEVP